MFKQLIDTKLAKDQFSNRQIDLFYEDFSTNKHFYNQNKKTDDKLHDFVDFQSFSASMLKWNHKGNPVMGDSVIPYLIQKARQDEREFYDGLLEGLVDGK